MVVCPGRGIQLGAHVEHPSLLVYPETEAFPCGLPFPMQGNGLLGPSRRWRPPVMERGVQVGGVGVGRHAAVAVGSQKRVRKLEFWGRIPQVMCQGPPPAVLSLARGCSVQGRLGTLASLEPLGLNLGTRGTMWCWGVSQACALTSVLPCVERGQGDEGPLGSACWTLSASHFRRASRPRPWACPPGRRWAS